MRRVMGNAIHRLGLPTDDTQVQGSAFITQRQQGLHQVQATDNPLLLRLDQVIRGHRGRGIAGQYPDHPVQRVGDPGQGSLQTFPAHTIRQRYPACTGQYRDQAFRYPVGVKLQGTAIAAHDERVIKHRRLPPQAFLTQAFPDRQQGLQGGFGSGGRHCRRCRGGGSGCDWWDRRQGAGTKPFQCHTDLALFIAHQDIQLLHRITGDTALAEARPGIYRGRQGAIDPQAP